MIGARNCGLSSVQRDAYAKAARSASVSPGGGRLAQRGRRLMVDEFNWLQSAVSCATSSRGSESQRHAPGGPPETHNAIWPLEFGSLSAVERSPAVGGNHIGERLLLYGSHCVAGYESRIVIGRDVVLVSDVGNRLGVNHLSSCAPATGRNWSWATRWV